MAPLLYEPGLNDQTVTWQTTVMSKPRMRLVANQLPRYRARQYGPCDERKTRTNARWNARASAVLGFLIYSLKFLKPRFVAETWPDFLKLQFVG
jgi:hypothetical protein